MNNSLVRHCFPGLPLLFAASLSFGADDVERADMHHGVKAKTISLPAPRYPRIEIFRDQKGNFSEALSTHDKLLEAPGSHPQLDKLEPSIKALREMSAGDKVLSVFGEPGTTFNLLEWPKASDS